MERKYIYPGTPLIVQYQLCTADNNNDLRYKTGIYYNMVLPNLTTFSPKSGDLRLD